MKSLDNKLIIYDSNCKVCSSLRDVVVRLTSIPEAKIKAYKDLGPELSQQVDPAIFRNVMALIDTSGEKTIYGAEGLAHIFSSQYRLVDYLFRLPFMLKLFTFFYKTQAYNRYIIATPKSQFQCDCFPDRVVKYRVSYIVLTLLISVLLTAMFGISLRNFVGGISPSAAALQMILMAGTGWMVQMILAIVVMRNKTLDYIGHLGSMMVAGLLILLPWMLFHAITAIANIYLPMISVVTSSAVMLYLHIHRIRHLELSQAWTVSWFLSLQSGAVYWIWFFYLNSTCMDLRKRIPVHYRGELHDVRLVNFSVAMEEVKHLVPAHIKIRDFNGRAMISMVDVQLKRMRPVLLPFVRFNYRHIAFRLLVDDSAYNDGTSKGIFFLRAFTDKPLMVAGGRMLTDYNLESANIEAHGNTVLIAQGNQHVRYCIGDPAPGTNEDLKQTIGALDRAYAVLGNAVRVTNIQREKWPIEPVHCTGFENTFFKSAKFEGAFRVFETIYYDWFPPEEVGSRQAR